MPKDFRRIHEGVQASSKKVNMFAFSPFWWVGVLGSWLSTLAGMSGILFSLLQKGDLISGRVC
jgi:hypothetical protein